MRSFVVQIGQCASHLDGYMVFSWTQFFGDVHFERRPEAYGDLLAVHERTRAVTDLPHIQDDPPPAIESTVETVQICSSSVALTARKHRPPHPPRVHFAANLYDLLTSSGSQKTGGKGDCSPVGG